MAKCKTQLGVCLFCDKECDGESNHHKDCFDNEMDEYFKMDVQKEFWSELDT